MKSAACQCVCVCVCVRVCVCVCVVQWQLRVPLLLRWRHLPAPMWHWRHQWRHRRRVSVLWRWRHRRVVMPAVLTGGRSLEVLCWVWVWWSLAMLATGCTGRVRPTRPTISSSVTAMLMTHSTTNTRTLSPRVRVVVVCGLDVRDGRAACDWRLSISCHLGSAYRQRLRFWWLVAVASYAAYCAVNYLRQGRYVVVVVCLCVC